MTSNTMRSDALEVTLNCSSINGYVIEFGYYLHHMKVNSPRRYEISKALSWFSRYQLNLKLLPYSAPTGEVIQSPLQNGIQQILDDFSNKLRIELEQAFDSEPARKFKRQTIVFFVRVFFDKKEVDCRKVIAITFNYFEELLEVIPRVEAAFNRSTCFKLENS